MDQASNSGLLDALTALFRQRGYDGTTLSRIMEATGLVKASLYHRFRGGKEEMAVAVMERAAEEFASRLLAPLSEPGDPEERLRRTGVRLREFYGSGKKACLLDTMTMSRESALVRAKAKGALRYWIQAFAGFAEEGGMPASLAAERARDAIAAIEGGLVVARVSGDAGAFLRAIESLPERLIWRGGIA